jgi:hypothetical protein
MGLACYVQYSEVHEKTRRIADKAHQLLSERIKIHCILGVVI